MAFDYVRNQLKRHYEEDFSSRAYLDEYHKPGAELPWWEKYFLLKFHEAFQEDNQKVNPDKTKAKRHCLEIGSGPTIHRLASCSLHYDTLTVSDISDDCRRYLNHYIHVLNPPSRRFQRFYETVAKLEGFEDLTQGALVIENRIRNKITGVLRCDVLDGTPMGQFDPVDAILTCHCLDIASVTLEDFTQCLKSLRRYLKPDGLLLLAGFLGGNYFLVEEDVVPCLQFDLGAVQDCLLDAGFDIVQIEECSATNSKGPLNDKTNCTSCYFSVSRKSNKSV